MVSCGSDPRRICQNPSLPKVRPAESYEEAVTGVNHMCLTDGQPSRDYDDLKSPPGAGLGTDLMVVVTSSTPMFARMTGYPRMLEPYKDNGVNCFAPPSACQLLSGRQYCFST